MIILVTGDRNWKNRRKIAVELHKRRKKIKLLIHGGARGADLIADEFAQIMGVQTAEFAANWQFHKRAAGPIRNSNQLRFAKAAATTLNEQLLVLAFHGNLKKSKGTRHMVSLARGQKVRVKVIK